MKLVAAIDDGPPSLYKGLDRFSSLLLLLPSDVAFTRVNPSHYLLPFIDTRRSLQRIIITDGNGGMSPIASRSISAQIVTRSANPTGGGST